MSNWKWLYSAPAVPETICNLLSNSVINEPFGGGLIISILCFTWMLRLADASQISNSAPVLVRRREESQDKGRVGQGSRSDGTVSDFLGE